MDDLKRTEKSETHSPRSYGRGRLEPLKFLPRDVPVKKFKLGFDRNLGRSLHAQRMLSQANVDMGKIQAVPKKRGKLEAFVAKPIRSGVKKMDLPVELKGKGGSEGFSIESSLGEQPLFKTITQPQLQDRYGKDFSADYRGRRLPQHMALMSRVMQRFIHEQGSVKRHPVEIQFGVALDTPEGSVLTSANRPDTRKAIGQFYRDNQGIDWINKTYGQLRSKHLSEGLGETEFNRMQDLYKVRNFAKLNEVRGKVNRDKEDPRDIALANQFMANVLGGNVTVLNPFTVGKKSKEKITGQEIHAEQIVGKRITNQKHNINDYFIGGSKIRCLSCATNIGHGHQMLLQKSHPTSGTLYPTGHPSKEGLRKMAESASTNKVATVQAHLTFRKRSRSVVMKRPKLE